MEEQDGTGRVSRLTGPAGSAERAPDSVLEGHPSNLVVWILTLPGQAVWTQYALSLIHLREMGAAMAAFKQSEEATHELLLAALAGRVSARAEDPSTWHMLVPVNLVHQVAGLDDGQAVHLAELVARGLVDGVLPAEPTGLPGALDYWRTCLDKTAAHIRTGRCPDCEERGREDD